MTMHRRDLLLGGALFGAGALLPRFLSPARAQAAAKLAELGTRLKVQSETADAALATTRTAAEADLQVVADDVANDLVRRLTGAAA